MIVKYRKAKKLRSKREASWTKFFQLKKKNKFLNYCGIFFYVPKENRKIKRTKFSLHTLIKEKLTETWCERSNEQSKNECDLDVVMVFWTWIGKRENDKRRTEGRDGGKKFISHPNSFYFCFRFWKIVMRVFEAFHSSCLSLCVVFFFMPCSR